MKKTLLTVSEVAEILRVSTRTVRRWVAWGVLPGVRATKRTIRIRKADLDEFFTTEELKKSAKQKGA